MARLLAGAFAPILGAAIVSQGWLSVRDVVAQGGSTLEGVSHYLCYFTVLTNCLVVLVLARAAWKPGDRTGLNAPRIELMTVVSIVFVGAVYNLLLASQWDPQGLRKLNDVILHDASPILFALFWMLRPRGGVGWRDGVFAGVWPLAYSVYGLARGAVDGFYPYFFMDPSRLAWPLVLANMAGLMAAFMAAALLLVGAEGRIRAQYST